uniref:Uncharacterized protein n=1 Tax=Anguilla anguilla TaxID=7936 RepID=A0A0E9RVN1_ANGAN
MITADKLNVKKQKARTNIIIINHHQLSNKSKYHTNSTIVKCMLIFNICKANFHKAYC